MEPDEIRAAWQRLRSSRPSPTSGLQSTLNLGQPCLSPRRLREPAQEPSPRLGGHGGAAWAPRAQPQLPFGRNLDLGPPRMATQSPCDPNVISYPVAVRTIATRRPGEHESRSGEDPPEDVGSRRIAAHTAESGLLPRIQEGSAALKENEKAMEEKLETMSTEYAKLLEALRQANEKERLWQAEKHSLQNELEATAMEAKEQQKKSVATLESLQEKLRVITVNNEQLQRELQQAEKEQLKKQLEDREQEVNNKEAASQADHDLRENKLKELAQEAEEKVKLASALQEKLHAITMNNEQRQQELRQAERKELEMKKSEQALQAEKDQLKKQLEDSQQEAKDREAASQAQLDLLKTELREAQQKAKLRDAEKEATDEAAFARRAAEDAKKAHETEEAEKNELRKQLEDKEQEAKAKEAASQAQIELLKTELREAQQKAESRAAGKEAADEAYARRAEQDAEQTQESQEAQLELLKKDLKDAQHKAEEAKKAPESKEVQPSLPAESVGETSEMDTQKSDGEKRWEITISKTTEDEKLGLGSSPAEDGKAMFVESLVEGLLEAWNAKCLATGELDCVVKPGDLIISCNGVTGYEEMIQEFRSKKTLQLSLLREAGTKQKKRWLEKVQRNGQSLENAPEHLRSDREVASAEKQQWLTKVKRDGFFLQIAPEHLQKDQEVVTAAVRQNGKALQFASKELKSNQDVVLAAVKASGLALEYAAEALRGEKEFVLAAVQQNGLALKFAAEALQSDKEIAVAAVRQNGLALEHAAPAMKEEKEVVMLAVQQDGRALKFAAAALQAEKEVVLAAVRQNGLALKFAAEALQGDKEIVMVAVQQDGRALKFAAAALQQEKEVVRASWLSRILEDGTKLQYAPEDLRGDREFLLDAVRATKAPWLVQLASKALQEDAELVDQVKREAGTGLVFTWYHSFDCFANMRKVIVATGASVPGGEAYAEVMKKLNATGGGSATVWFDTVPVWGFQANGGKWRHPPTDCGRNDVSVPPPEGRDPMWDSLVESRVSREAPAVGSKHPCHLVCVPNSIRIFMECFFDLIPSADSFSTTKWSAALVWLDTHVNIVCQGWCCHWLRKVKQKQAEGAIICCAVSNIYNDDWVEDFGAGSSELSDSLAEQYGLPKERFKNGPPPGWGEGEIEISNGDRFSRVAPEHPHTKMPLGAGCRWEREALDNLDCTVMAFFMP